MGVDDNMSATVLLVRYQIHSVSTMGQTSSITLSTMQPPKPYLVWDRVNRPPLSSSRALTTSASTRGAGSSLASIPSHDGPRSDLPNRLL